MTEHAIEIADLRKTYGRRSGGRVVALDDLTLAVPRGVVFGFLGPNGSGKTTTIRCMLSLARPDAGRCRVLGVDSQTELERVIARIGSVVEAPTFFAKMSGRRHLEILARAGGIGKGKIDQVLGVVGLSDRAGDRIKGYSLGMRQRLALAAVLMKDPDLLVLDEPGNGLDPAGIKELRGILRHLASEGRTVFVSSHLLSEVQVLCDAVGIVQRGRTVASGSVAEIVGRTRAPRTLVRTQDLKRARAALRKAGLEATIDGTVLTVESGDQALVNRTLARAEIFADEIRGEEISLEDAFLELTGGESGD